MNKRLAISVVFLLASMPSFGSHTQPTRSSQFTGKHSVPQAKSGRKTPSREGIGPAAVRAHDQNQTSKKSAAGTPKAKPKAAAASVVAGAGFVSAIQIPTGGANVDNGPSVMGDFDGDGKKDAALLVQNTVSGNPVFSISVMLSNGDNTFQAPVLTLTPGNSEDPIIVGDVNGDGKDDLLMVHPNACVSVPKGQTAKPVCSGSGSTFDVLISNGNGTFTLGHNYPISVSSLTGGVLIDSDGDGKLDLVAIDSEALGVELVSLGNGDGTFQTPTVLATLSAAAPGNIIFADFNGDGILDFEGSVANQVSVYLGSATGFALPVALTTSDSVYDSCGETVGDLSGDSKPEIVSVNCDDSTITIYLNNGDGSFLAGVYYDVAKNSVSDTIAYAYPYFATIADINGDGKNDIISSNYYGGDVTLLFGNGDGTVTVPTVGYAVGGFPYNPALVGDFNGDGLADILVSDDLFSMAYLQGYGDGTFRGALDYYSPTANGSYTYSEGIATGDFNGDGIPDFAVGQEADATLGITVFLSGANGSLQSGVNYGTGGTMYFVSVSDFNKDGNLDIAATDVNTGLVQIFTGNGDGTFATGGSYVTDTAEGGSPLGIVSGDFNHDGNPDLAVVNEGTLTLGVLPGDGTGVFGAPTTYALSQTGSDVAVADLNGDGFVDLLVSLNSGSVAVFMANNDSSGTFKAESDIAFNVSSLQGVAVGDLNGDGFADLAVTENDYPFSGIGIALGNGDGTFQSPIVYPNTLQNASFDFPNTAFIKMADINGDGKLDIVYTNAEYGTVGVILGVGDGTFLPPVESAAGGYAWDLALADVNGDGAIDVVTADDDFGGVTVLLNASGSATLPNFAVSAGTATATVTAGDSATYNLTLIGNNGYNGTITFTCTGLPDKTACVFSPASVVAVGNLPLTTTLTITTTAATTTGRMQPIGPNSNPGTPTFLASLGGLGLLGLVCAGSGKKRGRRQMSVLLGVMLLVMMFTMFGCGGDSQSTTQPPPPPPVVTPGTAAGTYAIVVTSTGTGATAPTHNVNVTLIVQ